jgi:hypothetical protein
MLGTAYLDERVAKDSQAHRIGYYRTTDWRDREGDFSNFVERWGEDQARQIADRIRERLADLLESSPLLMGFGFGINLRDFREVDSMPEAQASRRMREWLITRWPPIGTTNG